MRRKWRSEGEGRRRKERAFRRCLKQALVDRLWTDGLLCPFPFLALSQLSGYVQRLLSIQNNSLNRHWQIRRWKNEFLLP